MDKEIFKTSINSEQKIFDTVDEYYFNNPRLSDSIEYQQIIGTIRDLYINGVIQRSSGYCLSSSDMVYKILSANGIKSRIVECSLVIKTHNPPTLNIVGEDNLFEITSSNIMNSHVVVITETEVPMIIDLSIGHLYEYTNVPFILDELVEDTERKSVYKITYPNSTWVYQEKSNSKVPEIYQSSILNRIKTDKKIFKDIDYIKKIIYFIIIISSLNFFRGSYDFYQKYVNKSNGFGPVQTQRLK